MRLRGRLRGFGTAVLLACLAGSPARAQAPESAGGQDLAGSVERLRALREALDAERKATDELGGKEKSVLSEIEGLEKDLKLTREILNKLGQKERELTMDLAMTREILRQAQEQFLWRRQELARTLRHMYKHGRGHSLEVLFSSKSFPDLLENFRFLGKVARRNRQILFHIREERDRIDRTRVAIEQSTRDLEELKLQKEREGNRIQSAVGGRTKILEGIRTEKSQHERSVAELERSTRELETLIASLETERRGQSLEDLGGLQDLKGRLLSPVEGEVVVPFGKHRHPKFGTVTLSNGVDYRAEAGAPVKAVAPGRVEHVCWLTGYGQCAILSHGDGYYTLYAHLSEVTVAAGERVGGGQEIARVGETGSLIGPCLHFEIRRGRQALDPAEWVRSR